MIILYSAGYGNIYRNIENIETISLNDFVLNSDLRILQNPLKMYSITNCVPMESAASRSTEKGAKEEAYFINKPHKKHPPVGLYLLATNRTCTHALY